MGNDLLRFKVTHLAATVPDGVPITWRGREFASGPLDIELADGDEATANHGALDDEIPANHGVLDYASRRARALFHVRLSFPEFAGLLDELGVDGSLTRPVEAMLRSEGDILDDHSFALSGACELTPHGHLPRDATSADVLPGR
jgi:hypothetical protein